MMRRIRYQRIFFFNDRLRIQITFFLFCAFSKSSDGSLGVNQTYRRLVNKLQKQLTQNQAHFDVLSKQLDANWSAHLQNQRENNK